MLFDMPPSCNKPRVTVERPRAIQSVARRAWCAAEQGRGRAGKRPSREEAEQGRATPPWLSRPCLACSSHLPACMAGVATKEHSARITAWLVGKSEGARFHCPWHRCCFNQQGCCPVQQSGLTNPDLDARSTMGQPVPDFARLRRKTAEKERRVTQQAAADGLRRSLSSS